MTKPRKVQIKGLIRFSYLSEGGFALSEKTPEEVRSILYDPDRLVRRFALFERLTLHCIKAQHNPDFRVAVLIGDSLPKPAVERLSELIQDVPQMQLLSLPQLPMFNAINAAFGEMGDDPEATHTATFRLDDDDAMHRLTTDRIAKLSHGLLGLRNPIKPFCIAFNRGFYLDTAKQRNMVSEWYENTPLGVGLTLVAPVGERVNVYRRNHRKLGNYYDCHSEIERPMFIRSVHEDNDSWAQPTGRKGELTRKEISGVLHRGFGLSLADLRALHVS